MSLEWLYALDELRAYNIDTKEGKDRLASLIKTLPGLLQTARIQLPNKPRILCLMAGSCIEGIAFAELYKAQITCVDLQKRQLEKGRREARQRKINLETVLGDIKNVSRLVSGKFDLVTILGQPLPHISLNDFDQAIVSVKKLLTRKGALLIDQSDLIFRILPQYKDAFTSNTDPPVLSVHHNFSPRHGYFERLIYSQTRHEVAKIYLWAPWIIEYVLKKNNFPLVEVNPYNDAHHGASTFLFTARYSRD